MTRFEEDVIAAMRSTGTHHDTDSEERVMTAVTQKIATNRSTPRGRAPRRAIVAGVLTAAAACAVFIAAGSHGPSSTVSNAAPSGISPTSIDGMGDGRPTQLGKACPQAIHAANALTLATPKMPVWLPRQGSSLQASDSWKCDPESAPVVVFGPIVVSFETSAPGRADEGGGNDAEWGSIGYFQHWASAMGDGAYVTTVQGRPALVHPSSATANNSVMLVVNDTLVRLVAPGQVPTVKLLDLANSLDLPAAK